MRKLKPLAYNYVAQEMRSDKNGGADSNPDDIQV